MPIQVVNSPATTAGVAFQFSAGSFVWTFGLNSSLNLTDPQIEELHDTLKAVCTTDLPDPGDGPVNTDYVWRYTKSDVTF